MFNIAKHIRGDRVIWMVIILLSMISILAVYSSTGALAFKARHGNTIYYLVKQLIFLSLGIFIIISTSAVPYSYYSKVAKIFLYIAIPVLALTLVTGPSINEARRWLTLPGTGFTIQPSDFAKIAIIMYVARVLSLQQDHLHEFRGAYLQIMVPLVIVCGLILPANLSTSAILFVTAMTLMFVGRIPFKFLALTVAGGIAVLALFITLSMYFHVGGRIGTWKNRIENFVSGGDDEENFQVNRAKVAVVNGGLIGRGPGNSTQRNYLPHPYSDFIYAIIIEEYGIVGGVFVLFLYTWLFFRAGLIVRRSTKTFAALLALGLSMGLVLQAMINMAVAVNLVPVTGQTLPFVSMGGSSILFTSVSLGIILSVSHGIEEEKKGLKTQPVEAKKENG
jgi:cell division protein FtsW